MKWEAVHRALVGRKFRRRKDGRQETRLVADTTLGGAVCFRYGPRLKWSGQVSYAGWKKWVANAVELSSDSPVRDWICPTGCGQCCQGIEARACRPLKEGWCKHHTRSGCALLREKRPAVCRAYLCPTVAAETPAYEA